MVGHAEAGSPRSSAPPSCVLAVWLVVRNFQPPKAIGHGPDTRAPRASPTPGRSAPVPRGRGRPRAGDAGMPLLLSDLLEARPLRTDGGAGGRSSTAAGARLCPSNVRGRCASGWSWSRTRARSRAPPRAACRRDRRPMQGARREAARDGAAGLPRAPCSRAMAGSSEDVGRVKLGILEAGARVRAVHAAHGRRGGPRRHAAGLLDRQATRVANPQETR